MNRPLAGAAALAAALVFASAVRAQDLPVTLSGAPSAEAVGSLPFLGSQEEEEPGRPYESWQIALRVLRPLGRFNEVAGVDWNELYDTGVGFGFNYFLLFPTQHELLFGFYTSFSIDFLPGASTIVFSGGETLQPGDALLSRFMVGGKLREGFGQVYFEQYIGVGFNLFFGGTGTYTDTLGTVPDAEFYAISFTFAFEVGANLGVHLNPHVELVLGLAYELSKGPLPGIDLAIGDEDYGSLQSLVIQVSVIIRL